MATPVSPLCLQLMLLMGVAGLGLVPPADGVMLVLPITTADLATTLRWVSAVLAGLLAILPCVMALPGRAAQSRTVSEISSAVASMGRATQQNAAMVEETSAASRSLADEVNVLAERTARFRTGSANVTAVHYRPTMLRRHVVV